MGVGLRTATVRYKCACWILCGLPREGGKAHLSACALTTAPFFFIAVKPENIIMFPYHRHAQTVDDFGITMSSVQHHSDCKQLILAASSVLGGGNASEYTAQLKESTFKAPRTQKQAMATLRDYMVKICDWGCAIVTPPIAKLPKVHSAAYSSAMSGKLARRHGSSPQLTNTHSRLARAGTTIVGASSGSGMHSDAETDLSDSISSTASDDECQITPTARARRRCNGNAAMASPPRPERDPAFSSPKIQLYQPLNGRSPRGSLPFACPHIVMLHTLYSSSTDARTMWRDPSLLQPLVSAGYDAAAADVWSFGVTLWVCVCGSMPWSVAGPSSRHFRDFVRGTQPHVLGDEMLAPDSEYWHHAHETALGCQWRWPSSFSPALVDLLSGCLKVRGSERLSMQAVMEHAWFRDPTWSPSPSKQLTVSTS